MGSLNEFAGAGRFAWRMRIEPIRKILVSRKNLPLIHFVPVETPAGLHMLQPFHEGVKFLASAVLSGKLLEPRTKQGVERFMLGFCELPGLLD
jgi:hypothetical protein